LTSCDATSRGKTFLQELIDELEQELITKLASIKQKNETEIKKEKDEMSCLASSLKDEKQELEFHKNHSSNNQLFVVLRKQISLLCSILVYLVFQSYDQVLLAYQKVKTNV
jgi:uncharacterized membrane protein YgaE (UPF0421/DUF939 family)